MLIPYLLLRGGFVCHGRREEPPLRAGLGTAWCKQWNHTCVVLCPTAVSAAPFVLPAASIRVWGRKAWQECCVFIPCACSLSSCCAGLHVVCAQSFSCLRRWEELLRVGALFLYLPAPNCWAVGQWGCLQVVLPSALSSVLLCSSSSVLRAVQSPSCGRSVEEGGCRQGSHCPTLLPLPLLLLVLPSYVRIVACLAWPQVTNIISR